jgi:hypothetical protein
METQQQEVTTTTVTPRECALFTGLVNYEKMTWADVSANNNSQASAVSGCQLSWFSSKQLRTICSRLAIKGIKNIKKSKMVDKIVTTYRSRQVYNKITRQRNEGHDNNASTSTTPKPQKEVQCSFQMINILFSDTFAADFATLGNIADRNLLDSGRAGNDEIFWVGFTACSSNLIQWTLTTSISSTVTFLQDRITLIGERLFSMTGRSSERFGKVSMQTTKLH